jgi:hypothetical protein
MNVRACLFCFAFSAHAVSCSLAQELKADQSNYQPMNLTDLRLDYAKLINKRLVVTGELNYGFGNANLSSSATDFNVVTLDINHVARDERKIMLDQCQPSCMVTVRGRPQIDESEELVFLVENIAVDGPAEY